MEEFGTVPSREGSFLKNDYIQFQRFEVVKQLSAFKRGIHALDIVRSYIFNVFCVWSAMEPKKGAKTSIATYLCSVPVIEGDRGLATFC